MFEDIDQEEYCIIIQNDNSIKIGKLLNDLSKHKLNQTSDNKFNSILTVSEFSHVFQKLNQSNINIELNNDANFLSLIQYHTDNKALSDKNKEPDIKSLLPIVVKNSKVINNDTLDINNQPVKPPKLTRQNVELFNSPIY